MTIPSGRSSLVPSIPPPSPKSPPKYSDLYGKRREMARLHMHEREISFLEEELKSIEGLHPASRCCKEMVDFVVVNSDPLLPKKKNHGSCRRFWKWLCRVLYIDPYWICCYCCSNGCSLHLKLPHKCCDCKLCTTACLPQPTICALSKWRCWLCKDCCVIPSCCKFRCVSCPPCCTCQCSCSFSCPSCPNAHPCCCCCTESTWKKCSCMCTCPRMMC